MTPSDLQDAVALVLMAVGLLGLLGRIAWLDGMDPSDDMLVSQETMERLRATEQEPPQARRFR